jgi:hypothetical protein
MLPNANPVQEWLACVETDQCASDLDRPIICGIHFATRIHED